MKKSEEKVEDVKQEEKPRGFMILSIKDRFMIPQLFPERSNLITQILAKDISEKTIFTQDELKEFKIQSLPNGTVKWDNTTEKPKEVKFSEVEIKFLKEQVERVDHEGGFTPDLALTAIKIKEL